MSAFQSFADEHEQTFATNLLKQAGALHIDLDEAKAESAARKASDLVAKRLDAIMADLLNSDEERVLPGVSGSVLVQIGGDPVAVLSDKLYMVAQATYVRTAMDVLGTCESKSESEELSKAALAASPLPPLFDADGTRLRGGLVNLAGKVEGMINSARNAVGDALIRAGTKIKVHID